jgi:hypothetical protein
MAKLTVLQWVLYHEIPVGRLSSEMNNLLVRILRLAA